MQDELTLAATPDAQRARRATSPQLRAAAITNPAGQLGGCREVVHKHHELFTCRSYHVASGSCPERGGAVAPPFGHKVE